MQIKMFALGQVATNCYLFWEEGSTHCAVVDPADHGDKIAELIQKLGLEPVAILLTHSHFDHILGIKGLREVWPQLPIYCHPADIPEETTTRTFGQTFPTVAAFAPVTPYGEGDKVAVGPLVAEVLHTPGHTKGSVTLRVGEVLFTGDTLFRGSMGRTDLPGGSMKEIMESLARLGRLEGDYQVCPGHDRTSTLDTERAINYYMLEAMGVR